MFDYLEVAYKDSDYTIGIANRVCPGIYKVRVRAYNMSAFATCYTPGI